MPPIFHPPSPESNPDPGPDSPQNPEHWHDRRYLPHFTGNYISQFLTFRLKDALPEAVVKRWKQELNHLDQEKRNRRLRGRIERYMDQGYGKALLDEPELARTITDVLLYDDGDQYHLHSWTVMPNHVHVLITVIDDYSLPKVVKGWKSVSARRMNQIVYRTGSVWQRGYFDRFMRDIDQFWKTVRYIEFNPVKADLCQAPSDWEWGSAHFRKEKGVKVMDYD